MDKERQGGGKQIGVSWLTLIYLRDFSVLLRWFWEGGKGLKGRRKVSGSFAREHFVSLYE